MERRIAELEIKLSFAEEQIDELNRTAFRQQQSIEALQRAVQTLRDQLSASLPNEQRSLRDELPPHY